jgi:hypothetical protein
MRDIGVADVSVAEPKKCATGMTAQAMVLPQDCGDEQVCASGGVEGGVKQVLVRGASHSGHDLKGVAGHLRAKGHRVFTPTFWWEHTSSRRLNERHWANTFLLSAGGHYKIMEALGLNRDIEMCGRYQVCLSNPELLASKILEDSWD